LGEDAAANEARWQVDNLQGLKYNRRDEDGELPAFTEEKSGEPDSNGCALVWSVGGCRCAFGMLESHPSFIKSFDE
jgi:hypothetical protein